MLWSPADMQTVGSGKCARGSSGHQQTGTRCGRLLASNTPVGFVFMRVSTGKPNDKKQVLLKVRLVVYRQAHERRNSAALSSVTECWPTRIHSGFHPRTPTHTPRQSGNFRRGRCGPPRPCTTIG